MVPNIVGKLHIGILSAKGLAPKNQKGYADSYVNVHYGNNLIYTSKVIPMNLDPVWNEEFETNILEPFEVIKFEVYHKSDIGGDQQHNFMGYLIFKIEELSTQDPIKGWFELKKENNNQIVSGEISLMVKYTYSQEWNLAYNGALSLAMEKYDDAILSLTEAISNLKDTNVENYIAQLYKFRALAYQGVDKFTDAINDISYAISKDQRNPGFWFTKGKLYFDQGEYDKAKEAFQTGLENCPNNDLLKSSLKELELNSIALKTAKTLKEVLLFFEEGRYHEASSLLTRTLINSYPNNYLYFWYRSLAHLGNNKMDDAEKDILKVTNLNPNWPKENPKRQGELRKQGEVNILFKKRYFYLKNHFLFYYKKRDDLLPKGVILLYRINIQQKDKDLYLDASRRIFRIQGKSEKEARDWKMDIIGAIKEKLTFSPEQNLDSLQLQGDPFTYKRSFPLEKILKYRSNQFKHTQVVAEGIDYEGFLFKRGGFNTNWKRRYFILKKEHLYYFIDKPIAKDNVYSSVKDHIVISKYSPQDLQDPPHAFQLVSSIPGERIYSFYADSEQEKERWKTALINAIERSKAALSNDSVSLLKNPSRKTILIKDSLSLSSDSEISPNKLTPQNDSFKESTIIKVRDETQKIDRYGVSSSERKYFRKFDLEYDSNDSFFSSRSNDNFISHGPKSYGSESMEDLANGVETDDETEFLLSKSYDDYGELEKSKCCSSCTIL